MKKWVPAAALAIAGVACVTSAVCSASTAESGQRFHEIADTSITAKNMINDFDSLIAIRDMTEDQGYVYSDEKYVADICSHFQNIDFLPAQTKPSFARDTLLLIVNINQGKRISFCLLKTGEIFFENVAESSYQSKAADTSIYRTVYSSIWEAAAN